LRDTNDVILQADPNPVPAGNPDGKTTITWNTSSNDVGEVWVGDPANEKLFATGAKGSQEAAWIKPGSTEFRLYTQADHKLMAQLTVTMSTDAVSKPATTPVSSASP
jgi:hypothetical protein